MNRWSGYGAGAERLKTKCRVTKKEGLTIGGGIWLVVGCVVRQVVIKVEGRVVKKNATVWKKSSIFANYFIVNNI